jgi:hypothetical protein
MIITMAMTNGCRRGANLLAREAKVIMGNDANVSAAGGAATTAIRTIRTLPPVLSITRIHRSRDQAQLAGMLQVVKAAFQRDVFQLVRRDFDVGVDVDLVPFMISSLETSSTVSASPDDSSPLTLYLRRGTPQSYARP